MGLKELKELSAVIAWDAPLWWITPNEDVFEIAKSAGKDYASGDKLREYDFRRGYEQGMMAHRVLALQPNIPVERP